MTYHHFQAIMEDYSHLKIDQTNSNEGKIESANRCKYCDKEFKNLFMKTAHIKKIHEKVKISGFKCDFCDAIYRYQYDLVSHIETIHEGIYRFNCDSCPKAYGTAKLLREHTRSDHEENIYNCDICDNSFRRKKNLEAHVRAIHIIGKEKGTKEGKIKCEFCDTVLSRKYTLHEHVKNCHGWPKSKMECNTCAKEFDINEQSLKRHVKRMHSNITYECDHCTKVFKVKSVLASHIKSIHYGEGGKSKASCDLCKKDFPTNQRLLQHNQHVHENKLNFKCNLCNKAYNLKNVLNTHIKRVHDKSTLPKCVQCDKTFSNNSQLKSHIAYHHNDNLKPFKCELCDKYFPEEKSALRHRKTFHENTTNQTMTNSCY